MRGMKNVAVSVRNAIIRAGYRYICKPYFFARDPELVHNQMITVGNMLGRVWLGRALTSLLFNYSHPSLHTTVLGIAFKNPLGLSAGFDKNADLVGIIPSVGFGFEEVGSITGEYCPGNPKPRMWRLLKSKSLVIYYGLNNRGCVVLGQQLRRALFRIPVGTSIAMTNCAANLDRAHGIKDFAKAFRELADVGAYTTVNISCPNAQGGQPFVDSGALEALLTELDKIPTNKPVLIKLSPDLTFAQVDTLLDIAKAHRVHGVICTNLTKPRDNKAVVDDLANIPAVGGLSGAPTKELSDALIAHVYTREQGKCIIVGVGGISTAEDAYRKIRLGASLLQMITGMIFEGPQVVSEINQGLARLLARDGFTHVSQAVGVDVPLR